MIHLRPLPNSHNDALKALRDQKHDQLRAELKKLTPSEPEPDPPKPWWTTMN